MVKFACPQGIGRKGSLLFLLLPYPNFYIFNLYKLAAKWSKTGESSPSLYIYAHIYFTGKTRVIISMGFLRC